MAVNPIKTPFTNMSFTPDVPSSALSATEYNFGANVETDVRSIKSVLGDQYILSQIPGNAIFVTGGFRVGTVWWFIVATSQGKWWGLDAAGITDLTPSVGTFTGYNTNTVITGSWNGNVLFIEDGINPPMYLLPTASQFRLYDHAYTGQVPATYVWNYYADQGVTAITAGFLRVYNSPNLGALLVAGNLTEYYDNGTNTNFPTTIRWSQNFGLNAGPTTWAPTATNTANELEIPVRGPAIDGFPLNGNFYICSYWDTVVLSPIAYQASTAPVFGVKLINQGRGLLNENCWSNVDNTVFGLDARDVWSFDGGNFTPIGDQKVKNYLLGNINPLYTNQVFMVNNSSKYQIEIYYPDLTSTGYCNQMMSYRYDLQVWNPPRAVTNATQGTESPRWTSNVANLASRGVVYTTHNANVQLVQKDTGTSFLSNTAINSVFQRNNISFGQPYSNTVQVHRVFPEIYGQGNITIELGGSMNTQSAPVFVPAIVVPIETDNPWAQFDQNENRVVTLRVSSNSAVNSWQMAAADWQVTIVESDR